MLEHIIVVEISSYYILVILIKRIKSPRTFANLSIKKLLNTINGRDGTCIKLSLIQERVMVITGDSIPWFF